MILIISWLYYPHHPPVGICVYYNSHYYVCAWEDEGCADPLVCECVCLCLCLYPIIFVINNNNGTQCEHPRLCFEDLLCTRTHTYAQRHTHTLKLSPSLHLCLIGRGTAVVWASAPKPPAHWHKVKDPLTCPAEKLNSGRKGGRVKERCVGKNVKRERRRETERSCPPKALKPNPPRYEWWCCTRVDIQDPFAVTFNSTFFEIPGAWFTFKIKWEDVLKRDSVCLRIWMCPFSGNVSDWYFVAILPSQTVADGLKANW